MYQKYYCDTDGVRQPFWECCFIMATSVSIEGNCLAAQLEKRSLGNQSAIESLRNEMVTGMRHQTVATVQAIGGAVQNRRDIKLIAADDQQD